MAEIFDQSLSILVDFRIFLDCYLDLKLLYFFGKSFNGLELALKPSEKVFRVRGS
jgi:hypothetical protein